MEYINEININEAIIHILDNNEDGPVLNKYSLELTEEVYNFVFRHIQRCLKHEELRYAKFNDERNIVKEICYEYLNSENNLINVSQELARQMFKLMRSRGNIPSCDLLTVSFTTEHGAFIGIFKMDYIKNYMHNVQCVDGNIGIDIVSQLTGLPSSSSRIQKCAFIKALNINNEYDLLVIDKKNRKVKDEEYGLNYFTDSYLGCSMIQNDRDNTKKFIKATEEFIRNISSENAEVAEEIRTKIKDTLISNKDISIDSISDLLDKYKPGIKESYQINMSKHCDNEFEVDKKYIDKKFKKIAIGQGD